MCYSVFSILLLAMHPLGTTLLDAA